MAQERGAPPTFRRSPFYCARTLLVIGWIVSWCRTELLKVLVSRVVFLTEKGYVLLKQ